jgi:gluconate 2-dehydrogenase alpha chain
VNAKNSTAVTTIPAAKKFKNFSIFDNAQVKRVQTDDHGKVTGVLYIRDRKEYFQPAKAVLIASYAYENARLLLLSKSKAYPKGLSNNHGQVGRHYFGHWGTNVTALFPSDINIWYGLPAQGTTCDEWADDHFDHAGMGFVGGSSLHVYTERHPIDAAAMNTFGRAPGWGSAWKKFIHDAAARQAQTKPGRTRRTRHFTWTWMTSDITSAILCRITPVVFARTETVGLTRARQNGKWPRREPVK